MSMFTSGHNRNHGSIRYRLRPGLPAIVLALALVSITWLPACSSDDGPTPPAGTGTVSGTVMASATGVADATVQLAGGVTRSTDTDANGAYQFTGVPEGDYTVTVTLPAGFTLATGQTATKSATVAGGQTATVNWTADGSALQEVVSLAANSFVPAELTIAAGTTVRWEVDVGVHTVTPDNAAQQGAWQGTGTLNANDSFEFTFSEPGQVYDYHCTFHQATGMTGRIVVQ